MKKIFTILLSVSFVLAGNVASAQTNLTSEQKQVIQEEVLPAVFKQVNQQFGIDILSFMQPEKVFESVLKSSIASLRADDWTHTPMNIQPNSVIIPMEIKELGVSKLKLTFSEYVDIQLPTINRYPINLKFPKVIKVTGSALFDAFAIGMFLDPVAPSTEVISGLEISLTTVLTGKKDLAKLTFKRPVPSKAFEEYLGGFNLEVNIDGIRNLLSDPTLGKFLAGVIPDGFQLPAVNFSIPVSFELEKGLINASLRGIPVAAPAMTVPMGDAVVALNMYPAISLSNITLTSYTYEDGNEVPVVGWRRLWSTMEQKNSQDLVLRMRDYRFTSAAMTDSTYHGTTIYTMSDYTSGLPTTASLMSKALDNVAALLKSDQPTWYKMVIEELAEGAIEGEIQQVIEIIPYLEGDNAIAKVLMQDYKDGVEAGLTTIIATASTKSEEIVVDILDGEATLATLYFNSNALEVMGNETAPEVSGITIYNAENGLYITNADGALYSIINMNGARVATGYVNGDYIQTPVNKGIYILTVKVNGKTQAFKFAK